jgi:CheY-like chemotaxis protein
MIDITLRLAEDIGGIFADAGQIQQVLINLAVNAADAMPEGGQLTIETQNTVLDEDASTTSIGLQPGKYVQITVSDTGHGMDTETIQRIFEPFFTTKALGKGTGLGLAMVYGIVKGHGGHVQCHSRPDEGTTFQLFLPASNKGGSVSSTESLLHLGGGSEKIMLVDDEEPIRLLGQRILEQGGYSVLTASNGTEALQRFREHNNELSLVILDFIMPGMSGKECMDQLRLVNPEVKIVVASGFSMDEDTRQAFKKGAKGFVNKPYRLQELLASVREVLDSD